MEAIRQLEVLYWQYKLGCPDYQSCINWAIERLQLDQEGDDLDVVMLAASTHQDEALQLAGLIVQRYGSDALEIKEFAAGKIVVYLEGVYLKKRITLGALDSTLWGLASNLDYPKWLTSLASGSEWSYSQYSAIESFNAELGYVSDLWRHASSCKDFDLNYDPKVVQLIINKLTTQKTQNQKSKNWFLSLLYRFKPRPK